MAVQHTKCSFYSSKNLLLFLLLLSVVAEGQLLQSHDRNDETRQLLVRLFEETLVNSNKSLYQLQSIYFNPTSRQLGSSLICLSVDVTTNNTISSKCADSAFKCISQATNWEDLDCNYWSFESFYELQLATSDVESASLLIYLLSKYGSTGVFYAFDPTFFHIMKAFASSIAVSFPFCEIYNDDHAANSNNAEIKIHMHISSRLDEMPCWTQDDAVAALERTLMWVRSLLHDVQTRMQFSIS